MKASDFARLFATYGPAVIPLIQQFTAWIEGGDKTVTSADIQIIENFAKKLSGDYLAAQGIKIVDGKVVPV